MTKPELSEVLLHDAKTALMYEELRAAIDGGHESMTHADALAEIAAMRAENIELRAQLEAVGAGGVQALSAVLAKWGTQPQAGAVPQGWKAVPVNPTQEMWKAAKTVPDPNPPYPPHYGLVWDAMLAASPTPPAEQQAAPKAAPGVGNSGFDHQTAADFLSGKTVSDEAVRKFVAASRWAHDERAALSATLLAMHGVLTSREAEIALLKKALMEAEAAPRQEAQEPAPSAAVFGLRLVPVEPTDQMVQAAHHIDLSYMPGQEGADRAAIYRAMIAAAPQPAPAPVSDDVVRDAARYQWLRRWKGQEHEPPFTVQHEVDGTLWGGDLDAAVDAAIAAQGGK